MFQLTKPLVPLASDGGGAELPPDPPWGIDRRPFKPAGDGSDMPAEQRRINHAMTDAFNNPPQAAQPPRDPAIDAMVAQWLSEGWLYVHAPSGEYRTRDRRWREQTEDEKSWNA